MYIPDIEKYISLIDEDDEYAVDSNVGVNTVLVDEYEESNSNIPDIEKYTSLIDEIEDFDADNITSPLVITFCGRFKTGKSSLINSLLNIDYLPTKATTATAGVTKIAYGTQPKAYLHDNGRKQEISFDDAREYILFDRLKSTDDISELFFEIPSPILNTNVLFVDTPGLDDYPELEKITWKELEKTDLCILVLDAESIFSMNEMGTLEKIQNLLHGNIIFVINRINLLNTDDDLRAVLESANYRLKNYGNSLIGNGVVYHTCSLKTQIQFNGFDTWLKNILTSGQVHSIQQLSAYSRFYVRVTDRISELDARINELSSNLHQLQKLSEQEIISIKRNNSVMIENLCSSISKFRVEHQNDLDDILPVKTKIDHLKENPNWQDTFNKSAKNTVVYHYSKYFSELKVNFRRMYNQPFITYPEISVDTELDNVTFNSANAESSSWKGAAIGAGIGTLAIPVPVVGTLLGGLAGKFVDSVIAQVKTEDSAVPNALSLIESRVIPKMKENYSNLFRLIEINLRDYENKIEIHSSYERKIEECNRHYDVLSRIKSKLIAEKYYLTECIEKNQILPERK